MNSFLRTLFAKSRSVADDVGVGGEVHKEHPASMHGFDCRPVVDDFDDEGGSGLLISFDNGKDCIV